MSENTIPVNWGVYISSPKEVAFILDILHDVAQKAAAHILEKGEEYELLWAERDIMLILQDIGRITLHDREAVEAIAQSALAIAYQKQKEQDASSQALTQCHRCKKEMKRSELRSGSATKFGDLHYPADYYGLCLKCETNHLYECKGLTHVCHLCGNRHAPQLLRKGIPERLLAEICADCLNIPNILTEAKKVQTHLERTRKLSLPSTLTLKQWITTLAYFRWKCAYCNGDYHGIEHFIPVALGGGTTIDNCFPSCRSCNSRKGGKPMNDAIFSTENISRIREYLEIAPNIFEQGG